MKEAVLVKIQFELTLEITRKKADEIQQILYLFLCTPLKKEIIDLL